MRTAYASVVKWHRYPNGPWPSILSSVKKNIIPVGMLKNEIAVLKIIGIQYHAEGRFWFLPDTSKMRKIVMGRSV